MIRVLHNALCKNIDIIKADQIFSLNYSESNYIILALISHYFYLIPSK